MYVYIYAYIYIYTPQLCWALHDIIYVLRHGHFMVSLHDVHHACSWHCIMMFLKLYLGWNMHSQHMCTMAENTIYSVSFRNYIRGIFLVLVYMRLLLAMWLWLKAITIIAYIDHRFSIIAHRHPWPPLRRWTWVWLGRFSKFLLSCSKQRLQMTIKVR